MTRVHSQLGLCVRVSSLRELSAGSSREEIHGQGVWLLPARSSPGSCCCSVAQSCLTLCDPMDCSQPGFSVLHHLLELAQTHVHWVGDATNHLSSPSPAFIFPSIRVFSSESALHIRWPKYWSFSFSICLSNEYSELISFWIDWFDLLIVQGTLKSLLQHHSSRSSPLINPSRSTCLWIQAFHQGDHNHFL